MASPLDLRASDAEREHAVDLLRHHATAGRISVEELDERCTAALGARTRGRARGPAPRPAARGARGAPAPPPREARGIGVRPFTYEWHSTSPRTGRWRRPCATSRRRCTGARYELAERSSERLVFTYAHRPAWTYVVAVGLFPFGLIALLHTAEERIVLDFDRARGGATRLVVTGRAPRSVRRAFAELEAG